MPTISIFYGIMIVMYPYSKEHNPPHIHAFYGEYSATFYIKSGTTKNKDFPKRAAAMVKEFILMYKNELLDMWSTGTYRKLKGLE